MNDFPVSYFGSKPEVGLFTQFRVMQYRDGTHYPVKTFWTSRDLTVINPDRVYFFSPALRRFGKTQVEGSLFAWLDFDDVDVEPEYHQEPSLVVSTGGGFHVYWRLADFEPFETLPGILQRLHVIYPTSDKMCLDPTRFLRWPGSYNPKYSPARQVVVVRQNDVRYNLTTLCFKV